MSAPNASNAVAARPEHQVAARPEARLKSLLDQPSVRERFEQMLGKRAPSFTSSIISAVSANKQLAECEPMSVIASAAVAAAMDLPINSSLGFAHIVPYKGVAQFQMGWKGFIQLAMRSGQYKTINATTVYEGQIKNHNPFTGEMEFSMQATSDTPVGYLLYFKLLNGYEKYFFMTHEEVLAHGKKYSASFKRGFGMWVDDFEAMALKTVVKLGLSKYGVLSIDMQKAVEFDQAVVGEDGEPKFMDAEFREVSQPEPSRSEQLAARAQSAAEAPKVAPVVIQSAKAEAPAAPVQPPEQGSFDAFQESRVASPAAPSVPREAPVAPTAARTRQHILASVLKLAKKLGVDPLAEAQREIKKDLPQATADELEYLEQALDFRLNGGK